MPVKMSYEVEVEGRIKFLMLVMEAYKLNIFTLEELLNILIDFIDHLE